MGEHQLQHIITYSEDGKYRFANFLSESELCMTGYQNRVFVDCAYSSHTVECFWQINFIAFNMAFVLLHFKTKSFTSINWCKWCEQKNVLNVSLFGTNWRILNESFRSKLFASRRLTQNKNNNFIVFFFFSLLPLVFIGSN